MVGMFLSSVSTCCYIHIYRVCAHLTVILPLINVVYREDTPSRLSFKEVISGLLNSTVTRFKHWAHLGLVLFMWLIIVPLFIGKPQEYVQAPTSYHSVLLGCNAYECTYMYINSNLHIFFSFTARIYYFLIYNSLWSIYLLPVHLLSM